MELRDKNMNLKGWYIGRYENGIRHGLGQNVWIESQYNQQSSEGIFSEFQSSQYSEKYRIVERIYNKGHLLNTTGALKPKEDLLVDDILSSLQYFGYMGLIDQQDEEVDQNSDFEYGSVQGNNNDLNNRLNLRMFDREFPEQK